MSLNRDDYRVFHERPLLGVGAILTPSSKDLYERQQAALAFASKAAYITPEGTRDAVSAYIDHMRESEPLVLPREIRECSYPSCDHNTLVRDEGQCVCAERRAALVAELEHAR